MITVLTGDIFKSECQTLTNTVNCVGVMGKGIALGFRRKFPEMYEDYVSRCERKSVKLGQPYVYKNRIRPWVLNFPTKDHWRQGSSLSAIVDGFNTLNRNYRKWGITSLAVPPLGSGLGGLEWRVVGPTLYRELSKLDIPVELYAPFETPSVELTHDFLAVQGTLMDVAAPSKIQPGWLALVEIANTVADSRFHTDIGRVMFQKIAYFAVKRGIDIGVTFERGTYGPYAKSLTKIVNSLVNNGLLTESMEGRKIVHRPGPTYSDVLKSDEFMEAIAEWNDEIDSVVDLVLRMRSSRQAELAASVIFAADTLAKQSSGSVSEAEIVEYVLEWKRNREPFFYDRSETIEAVRMLQIFGWMQAIPSKSLDEGEVIAQL